MTNNEMMNIQLNRLETLDLHMAILNVINEFKAEINDETLSDTRRQNAKSAIDHRWQPLLDKLEKQFEEQDK